MLSLSTEAVKLHQHATPDVDGLYSFDFQVQIENHMLDDTTRAIFAHAETGAGKTRGFTLPALKNGKNLIIVAPTNALIHDIQKNVIKLCKQINAPHEVHMITRYALYALKGRTPPGKGTSQGQALLGILKEEEGTPNKPKVLVTNPDSLAIALQALYYNSETILREILNRYPWIVFDEFHAYAPKQIPAILYLHALIDLTNHRDRKTIFSSATPNGRFHEALQKLLELPDSAFIQVHAENNPDGFQVLQSTNFTLVASESAWDTSALRNYIQQNMAIIRTHLTVTRQGERRVCIIANSVFEASEITDMLVRHGYKRGQDVEEIRGFLAPGERGRGRCPIVVGTSAIEMGVNFPISLLFTEGSEGPALIQRLGRLGRSDLPIAAEAHAIVPQAVYDKLIVFDERTLSRYEFRTRILDAYPQFEDFWSYVDQFGLYENRFYIQRMEEMNTRNRHPNQPKTSPRQRGYLEQQLLPKLANGYGVIDWEQHLLELDEEINQKGSRAVEALERILSSPRGETVPVTCAIFDRADLQRGLFPFKIYDARLLLTRGDIVDSAPWETYKDSNGDSRKRPPPWYSDAARKHGKKYPEHWTDHWQAVESGNIGMFVDLNGLKDEYSKVEYASREKFRGMKQGKLYALQLEYWSELLGFFNSADFSEALQDFSVLAVSLQYGRYQGVLKQIRNLQPMFAVETLHLSSSAYQVAFGINALYIWSKQRVDETDDDLSTV